MNKKVATNMYKTRKEESMKEREKKEKGKESMLIQVNIQAFKKQEIITINKAIGNENEWKDDGADDWMNKMAGRKKKLFGRIDWLKWNEMRKNWMKFVCEAGC